MRPGGRKGVYSLQKPRTVENKPRRKPRQDLLDLRCIYAVNWTSFTDAAYRPLNYDTHAEGLVRLKLGLGL